MSNEVKIYVDLKGSVWELSELSVVERELFANLRARVASHPDWNDFDNYWLPRVAALYEGQGLSRREVISQPVYQLAQDLSSRLSLALRLTCMLDYRGQLRELIRTHFKTRRAFCEAAGLSEDMLSHVLAGRKHLAIDTLADALKKIGYQIRLVPDPNAKAG